MSKQTETELLDLAQWFNYWKKEPMSIDKKIEFMTKTIDVMLWVMAGNTGDIQKLEGRGGIILPRQMVRTDSHLKTDHGYTIRE